MGRTATKMRTLAFGAMLAVPMGAACGCALRSASDEAVGRAQQAGTPQDAGLPLLYGGYLDAGPNGETVTFGGNVVSTAYVIQVLYGAGNAGSGDGDYLPEVVGTGTPSMSSFYQSVLNSSYVDWLVEYDTTNINPNFLEPAGAYTLPVPSNQTIGRGTFVRQYTINPPAAYEEGDYGCMGICQF